MQWVEQCHHKGIAMPGCPALVRQPSRQARLMWLYFPVATVEHCRF